MIIFLDQDGDKLGNKAYRLRIPESGDEDEISNSMNMLTRLSKLSITEENNASEYDSDGFTDSDDDRLSHTQTPPPDDTKRKFYFLFFNDKIFISYAERTVPYSTLQRGFLN